MNKSNRLWCIWLDEQENKYRWKEYCPNQSTTQVYDHAHEWVEAMGEGKSKTLKWAKKNQRNNTMVRSKTNNTYG